PCLAVYNAPCPRTIYTLSLHDALPIFNLLQVADLLNIANSYNVVHLTYVRQARWPASTLLLLFRSFFTLVLLQQIETAEQQQQRDRKSTRLNSSHRTTSYALFCLK